MPQKRCLIVLGGSLARGDFVPGYSDIDLLVVCDTLFSPFIRKSRQELFPRCAIGLNHITYKSFEAITGSTEAADACRLEALVAESSTGKAVEFLDRIGRDSKLLHGDYPANVRSLPKLTKLVAIKTGIQTCIRMAGHLRLTKPTTRRMRFIYARKSIGQVANICRLLLRQHGCDAVLSHKNLIDLIQLDGNIPNSAYDLLQRCSDCVRRSPLQGGFRSGTLGVLAQQSVHVFNEITQRNRTLCG
jgi:hypothetical protein